MTSILAFDTSTETCSVALLHRGELREDVRLLPREHAKYLLPMIDELLAGQAVRLSELQAVAFGRGPGSFTGLRVCAAVAQGLAFSAGLPVVPVSSLRSLAQSAVTAHGVAPGSHIVAALDARMAELYWAAFLVDEQGFVQAVGEERLSSPETLEAYAGDIVGDWLGVGSGWRCIGAPFPAGRLDRELVPHAAAIAQLAEQSLLRGESCAAEQAVPSYLRDDVAWQTS